MEGTEPFLDAQSDDLFAATAGYTSEVGCETAISNEQAVDFWCDLLGTGVKSYGLGAYDTLRLEAGINLYG